MRFKNYFIVFALCLSLLLLMVHLVPNAMALEHSVEISCGGQPVNSITLDATEQKTLSAKAVAMDQPSFQWQILQDPQNDLWVDIYDCTEADCVVTSALMKSMLDDADSAYIRCVATSGAEKVFSDVVCVTVIPEPDPMLQATSFAQAKAVDSSAAVPVVAAAEDDSSEFVTITIKYLEVSSLTSGVEAAIYNPYTATIEKGSAFKQNVVSPTFLGFAPYRDSDNNRVIDEDVDESAATLHLDIPSVNDNIEYKVYYKPIKVDFAVKYFFQNIHDDLYTEDATRYHTGKAETGTIISDKYLQDKAGITTGFTKMYHIPESVAADGSTVFECYYDRNYYLMQFDLNGGYGVDPIYARYGTPFIVNNPIRHGYQFAGWQLTHVDADGDGDRDDSLPDDAPSGLVSAIPAYNCYYQAQWQTVDTTYTVVYWLKSGDDSYDYLTSKSVSAKSGDKVSGSDDLSSVEEDTKYYEFVSANKNVIVEGDGSTVVNVYYKPREYTLRFYYAATTGTGTDSDNDGVVDTYESVKIIGGSTYSFGANGYSTSDDETLLNNIFSTDQVGTVTKLPQLNAEGESRNYTLETLTSGNTSYHYIEFTASYGQDISELWPCSVFESATRTAPNTHGKWSGTEAFVSAWNGEHHVWYSQNNGNQTIKGNYEKLDKKLLFDLSKFSDEPTVSYLCFWENGANISWSVPKLFRYNIWVPVLEGENTNELITKEYDGVIYKRIASYDTCDDSYTNTQTQPSLEGYKANGYDYDVITLTAEQMMQYSQGYDMHFYYARESYSFAMKNHGEYLVNLKVDAGGDGGVAYGTKLSTLDVDAVKNLGANYKPLYPSTLEENAYYFGGWYTTEQCIPGTEFDLSAATMPASGLILYANWVPMQHEVKFYTTYDDMLGEETPYTSRNISHGNVCEQVATPQRTGDGLLDLTFAGWFYMENGRKKAFSPLNMPVNRDMDIFAEWSSHSPQPYRISYVLKSDPNIKVADDSEGYAYGGSTRTFNAKAGDPYNQLYDEYNNGYFPTVSSHSITIQADDKDNLQHNVFTFEYVKAQNIEYTVRYVNKETNVVMDEITENTSSAVVTERFKAYTDMVPDAFYKRLVLEVEQDENGDWVGTDNNVITFYYTPNNTSAYYAVHFMLEKLNATDEEKTNYAINGTGGYEKSGAHVEGVGAIGSTISYTPQQISGFRLITNDKVPILYSDGTKPEHVETDSNGDYNIPIKQSGTELYLFYERNSYPYKVHYYEYNTTISRKDSKTGTADYGSEVTETAATIDGYTCVSDQRKTITIREDENGENGLNVIIFYYSPKQYTAEYVAVPEDGGKLSHTREVIGGGDSLVGSAPMANTNYEFDGWYLDNECTISVTDQGTIDSETNKFIPDKSKLSETGRNIFYAKFVKKVGDFTITRSNANTQDDPNQVFVYKVKNNDNNEVITVTIVGNDSVTIKDLPMGDYTVTQKNNWSWRYTDDDVFVNHQNAAGTTVTFGVAEENNKWINGNSPLKKNRKGQ